MLVMRHMFLKFLVCLLSATPYLSVGQMLGQVLLRRSHGAHAELQTVRSATRDYAVTDL